MDGLTRALDKAAQRQAFDEKYGAQADQIIKYLDKARIGLDRSRQMLSKRLAKEKAAGDEASVEKTRQEISAFIQHRYEVVAMQDEIKQVVNSRRAL